MVPGVLSRGDCPASNVIISDVCKVDGALDSEFIKTLYYDHLSLNIDVTKTRRYLTWCNVFWSRSRATIKLIIFCSLLRATVFRINFLLSPFMDVHSTSLNPPISTICFMLSSLIILPFSVTRKHCLWKKHRYYQSNTIPVDTYKTVEAKCRSLINEH